MSGQDVVPGDAWPIAPAPATAATAGWWDATRERRLVVQRCGSCAHHQHHPRAICTCCGSTDHLGWIDAAGTGRVRSHTVVHRAPSPDLTAPYLLVLVELDVGVTMLSQLVADDLDLTDPTLDVCDRPVEVIWRAIDGDDRHLPFFRLTD